MPAVILAAGQGRRLGDTAAERPKILLEFGGKTLLQRHLELLRQVGAGPVTVVVGYRRELIEDELRRIGLEGEVAIVENPDWRQGSVVSLHQARAVLCAGCPVLLLDGDVLYDRRLLDALLAEGREGVLLLDRDLEPGDEPVKICVDEDGTIVDFAKRPEQPGRWHGESVGFFRFSPALAARLAGRLAALVENGGRALEYEEPIRAMIRDPHTRDLFGFADISGAPWTEIDFPADVAKAQALMGGLLA